MLSARPKSSGTRFSAFALGGVFCISIWAPLILSTWTVAFRHDALAEGQEVTPPAAPTTFGELLHWPGQFKWYFQNEFGFRRSLIKLHAILKVRGLHTSSNPEVLLGKNDWLFLDSERVLEFHRHTQPFTKDQLSAWIQTLESRQSYLSEKGIAYAFIVTPNKHSIYPEQLPESVAAGSPETRTDQLKNALNARISGIDFIDVRSALRQKSANPPLFYRSDTHWNAAGAWFASVAVADQLGRLLAPLDTPFTYNKIGGGDLARMLGLAASWTDLDPWPEHWTSPLVDELGRALVWKTQDVEGRNRVVAINPKGIGTALVFRDSFGEALIPWISMLFHRTVWLWTYDFDKDAIEKESPEIVLSQLVERKLMTIDP